MCVWCLGPLLAAESVSVMHSSLLCRVSGERQNFSKCHYSSVPILALPLQSLRTPLLADGKLSARNTKRLGRKKTREGRKRGRMRLSLHIIQLSWQDVDWASLVISFLQVSWYFLETIIAAALSSLTLLYLLSVLCRLSLILSLLQHAPISLYLSLACSLLLSVQYDLRSSMLLNH